ncbi:MAG: hypothetical protein JWM57_1711 [Phycisphaerales bacterium]|nr:hypothetical protein [Phycisphaerales bacterium]
MRDIETDDELDTLLRTALADRPEPLSTADFATRAMAMAALPSPAAAAIARPARVPVWPIWLAALAIVGMIYFGFTKLMNLGLSTSSSSSSDTSVSDAFSGDTTLLLEVGVVVFMISVVWVVTRSAFEVSGNEQTLRIA